MARETSTSSTSLLLSSQQHTAPSQHGGISGPSKNTGGDTSVLFEEDKIRDTALRIHTCLFQAQKLASNPQQTSTAATQQLEEALEISSRLNEAILYLQEATHDSSLSGLQERFNVMATKLNLKFDVQYSSQSETTSLFLTCDAYYVEICCQASGYVTSVKLAQANKQVDSDVLTQLVRASKFDVFESHMVSLKEFYAKSSSNAEASNLYRVMASIESVLLCITNMSPPQASLSDVILNNPLGHVIPRSAGIPMKLLFFVHPCQVLKCPSLFTSHSSHMHELDGPEMGVSAKLLLESSTNIYPLSVDPNLFDVSKATFFPIVPQNSVNINVNYVLHISKEFPVCEVIRKELHKVVYPKDQNYQPLKGPHINQLIARETASGAGVEVCTNRSRVVCLPSQRHYYYMPDDLRSHDLSPDQGHPPAQCAMMKSKFAFLHPVHIFSIVTLLRKQLVYNSLVASVLGRNPLDLQSTTSQDKEFMFEVTTHVPDKVRVTVDMQCPDSYLALDFVIPDQRPTSPLVKVKVGKDGVITDNSKLSMIVKKSMSIPVTLYAVVKSPRLLGPTGEQLFQEYLQTIADFNSELSGQRS